MDETQYLAELKRCILEGHLCSDRTGVGTVSLFGLSLRFDISNNKIPLLTTRRIYWKGVVEELLWFLRGETDSKILARKDVHIWDKNGSQEFLNSRGLANREEGDLGPIYGFQWRHFGAEYRDCHTDYTGQGIDQIAEVLRQIREEPDSRRIILSAWNPAAINQMSLPPCHVMTQFRVYRGKLSCALFQRSGDLGLGIPFNIASYSLLTHILAHKCGLETGELVHFIGDAHIYLNHIDPIEKQIERTPRGWPKVKILANKQIDKYEFADFELLNYNPHPSIQMKMAV